MVYNNTWFFAIYINTCMMIKWNWSDNDKNNFKLTTLNLDWCLQDKCLPKICERIFKIMWQHLTNLNSYLYVWKRTKVFVMSSFFSSLWTSVIEYETPRLVRIHNRKLGLVRRLIQASIVAYVCLYALWLQRGYQAGWTMILFKQ